jgi:hypothetical protein
MMIMANDSETPIFPVFAKEILLGHSGAKGRRIAYDPVDINGAYLSGRLYYGVQTLVRDFEIVRHPDGREEEIATERQEAVVVRSDRTVHTAIRSKMPRQASADAAVWRLGGTLISGPPRANRWATWRWPSIHAYLEGRSTPRPLQTIIRDILDTLRQAVYLPREEDYALLAFVVPVTFLQAVFDAVPLIMVTGATGTGKTLIGRFMARLCANATIVGVASPATIARQIDESRGFTVFDDIEKIGKKVGHESAQFSDLIQSLKLSYCKQTAVKILTDVTTMQVQKLNFFGVKLLNNTSGVDDILGSRMFRIPTATMPPDFAAREADGAERLLNLRDELHTWAFSNVKQVADVYTRLFPAHSNRAAEIAAPLQVLAEITADRELKQMLAAALSKQNEVPVHVSSRHDLMRNAVEIMIKAGQLEISPLHLLLEMRSAAAAMRTPGPDVSKLTVAWVGRMLRIAGVVPKGAIARRERLYGLNLNLLPIDPHYVIRVHGSMEAFRAVPVKNPLLFCRSQQCGTCRFAAHQCLLRPEKLKTSAPPKVLAVA